MLGELNNVRLWSSSVEMTTLYIAHDCSVYQIGARIPMQIYYD